MKSTTSQAEASYAMGEIAVWRASAFGGSPANVPLDKNDFVSQSIIMESNWAAEHLQVIRTLMERASLYRRALAPIMIYNGLLGISAGALGWVFKIVSPPKTASWAAPYGLAQERRLPWSAATPDAR